MYFRVRNLLKRRKSVRSILFFYNVILIVVTISFFTVFFYYYASKLLKNRAINSFKNLSSSLVSNLDSEILKINIISLNATYSKIFKELVTEHLAFQNIETDEERLQKYHNAMKISDYLQSLIVPFKPVPQINYYDFHGEMIGAGIFSRIASIDVNGVPWFGSIDRVSGFKMFTLPHNDELLEETFPLYEDQMYISLYRTFFNNYNEPIGVIEVKQFVDMIFKEFSKYESKIYVFNSSGQQLYPFNIKEYSFNLQELEAAPEGEMISLVNNQTSMKELVIVASCNQANWKVVIAEEEKLLLKPVRDFTKFILLFGVVLMGAALYFAMRFSKKFTTPLKEIHNAVDGLDWHSLSSGNPTEIPSDLNELEELEIAFRRMQVKLKDSMKEALEAKTRELHATMLALQNQMDPHFIYNILTTVSIMAEEGMVSEISEIVDHLTHLLRYISSSSQSYVTLGQEVEYAKRYLTCMKIRFRDSLFFTISIPKEIYAIKVPKLIIQPIIENAMKYGMNTAPPWKVDMTGQSENKRWTITISDSGPGFNEENLQEIQREMLEREAEHYDGSLQINGMGLSNIFLRLRLYYGDASFFKIENRPKGGARVTIGGAYEPRR